MISFAVLLYFLLKSSLLCCCVVEEEEFNTELEPCLERVEAAFRKFDLDGDGFVSWEEFKQVRKMVQERVLTTHIIRLE